MSKRINAYINKTDKLTDFIEENANWLKEEDTKYDKDKAFLNLLSSVRRYMENDLEQFVFHDYPQVWYDIYGIETPEYDPDDISYMLEAAENENVNYYRIEKEDLEEENEPYMGYARSGDTDESPSHTLYIRSLEIDGEKRYYIGIAKYGSKQRLEGDRYYMSNENFHRDMQSAIKEKVMATDTLSSDDKNYVLEKIEKYFAGKKDREKGWTAEYPLKEIKVDRELNINGQKKHYDHITKILDDVGIPVTLDMSVHLTGKQAAFLERVFIETFDLTHSAFAYNKQMGGDHILPWPVTVERKDENGRMHEDTFSSLNEAAHYIPELGLLDNIDAISIKRISDMDKAVNNAIDRHNDRAIRILSGKMTPKEKEAYEKADDEEKERLETIIDKSRITIKPYNRGTNRLHRLLTAFFYERYGRGNSMPLCVMRNGYFVKMRFGLDNAKKDYQSKTEANTQAFVEKSIKSFSPLYGDKTVGVATDIPRLKIPKSMHPEKWLSLERKDEKPEGCIPCVSKTVKRKIDGKEQRFEYKIYIWEKQGRAYWYSNCPTIEIDDRLLSRMKSLKAIDTKGLFMPVSNGKELYHHIIRCTPAKYIDGESIRDLEKQQILA